MRNTLADLVMSNCSILLKKLKANLFMASIDNHLHCNDPRDVDLLQKTCYQQADIRMRSHGLRQLGDDKYVTSCQQVAS